MSMQTPFEPYPGLRPYRETEKNNFFGRETDTAILIDKILTNRFTLLFAASGVGKSSLLQAAVIPRLKSSLGENLVVVYHSDWVSEPVQTVKAAVLKALQTKETFPKDLELAEEDLHGLLSLACVFVRPPLVLILDQFEEFFRYQRATRSFNEFIDQLVAVLADKSLAVSLVFSMREDFALELNAFKNKLLTLLFENFYRLEKLNRDNTLIAIKAPVEQLGYQYEPRLLEWLLADLLNREYDYRASQSIAEIRMTAEPPYLQIVCAQLWELNKNDPEKMIRLASYEKAGRAQGIIKNYIQGILAGFSHAEKQLASKAFDHLIGQRGVKIAYTAKALAEIGRVPEQDLAKVLDKLEAVRVLRRQQRGEEIWFELYHDLFSRSLDDWNKDWKDHLRFRRALKWIASGIVATLVIVSVSDFAINRYSYHFRLGKEGISDRIELWQGSSPNGHWLFDLFHQRQYIAETDFTRNDLEPDKRFEKKNIDKYKGLTNELIDQQPIEHRIHSYARYGIYKSKNRKAALPLAENLIKINSNKAEEAIYNIANVNTPEAAHLIYDILKKTSSDNLQKLIYENPAMNKIGLGVVLSREGLNKVINLKNISNGASEFWQNQFALQVMNEKTVDVWLEWGVYTNYMNSLSVVSKDENVTSYLQSVLKENTDNYDLLQSVIKLFGVMQKDSFISELVNLLKSDSESVRLSTVDSLVDLQAKEAVNFLIELTKEPFNDKSMVQAIEALGFFKSKAALPVLISTLQDPTSSDELKIATLNSIVELQKEQAIPQLIKVLQETNNIISQESIDLLVDLKIEKSLPYFVLMLNNRDAYIRKVAANAVEEFNSKSVVPELISLLNNPNGFIDARIEVAGLLARMKAYDAIPDLMQLRNEFSHADISDFRLAVLTSLVDLNVLDAIPEFMSLVEKRPTNLLVEENFKQLQPEPIASKLISYLDGKSKEMRILSIKILGEFKTNEAKAKLLELLNDNDPDIRLATINALNNMEVKIPINNLSEIFKEFSINYSKLSQLKKSFILLDDSSFNGIFLNFINDENNRISLYATDILKDFFIYKVIPLATQSIPSNRSNIIFFQKFIDNITDFDPIFFYPNMIGYINGLYRNEMIISSINNSKVFNSQQVVLFPHLIQFMINNKDKEISRVADKFKYLNPDLCLAVLLRLLKNGHAHIQKAAIAAVFALQEANSLSLEQKSLLQQALSLTDPILREETEKEWQTYKKTQVEPALSESAKRFNAMTNEELIACIADAEVKMTEWRAQREADLLKVVDTFELVPPNTAEAYRSWQVFQCAFDLSKREPNEGKKLLMHNLFDVREAAAMGMASSPKLKVSDIKELEQQWLATKDPIRHNAIFRAIDLGLLNIEAVGQDPELAELNQYLAELKQLKPLDDEAEHPSQAAIFPRVDWTQAQLQWRSETLKQNIQAYNEQLPSWLKEYCLNPDGSYMQPEQCDNPQLKALLPAVSSVFEVHHD